MCGVHSNTATRNTSPAPNSVSPALETTSPESPRCAALDRLLNASPQCNKNTLYTRQEVFGNLFDCETGEAGARAQVFEEAELGGGKVCRR